jgi:D-beta-D-heptose 7-phosphate kinase/D-beta-D-heptose 1-phosphate adenosyltransferase
MGRVVSLDTAAAHRRELRSAGKTVVFTNGLFDLLHAGHLDYLERAGALGDVLIIGLNSDVSSRALRGANHPIMPQEERGRLLSALSMVDMVVLFDDTTATTLLDALKPDIYVKGGDYSRKEWPEKETALAIGCRVELLPFLEGYSTSRLIETILARFGRNGPNG